jgi:hypothetical protein
MVLQLYLKKIDDKSDLGFLNNMKIDFLKAGLKFPNFSLLTIKKEVQDSYITQVYLHKISIKQFVKTSNTHKEC